jgi:GTPase
MKPRRKSVMHDRRPKVSKAVVVYPEFTSAKVGDSPRSPSARLDEAVALASAIDLVVVEALILPVRAANPRSLFGSGQVERLRLLCETNAAGLLIVDGVVSPVQQRSLEEALGVKVLDRTGLILEIFGARARTREGVLQVELAHLTYQQSRLVRTWTHLERQRGGFGFLGGPGETQIETDRRLIRDRIASLKQQLDGVRRTRSLHRRRRQKAPYPVVALVGYTNAGKSTLFNRLSSATVLAKDQLFATLDPTLRAIQLLGAGKVVLSDTVGFISDLPTQLVAAFRATLEEVIEADLVIHVRDIAHADSAAQAQDVDAVLGDLNVTAESGHNILTVWNKIDLLEGEGHAGLVQRATLSADCVAISAVTGEGIEALGEKIAQGLATRARVVTLTIPFDRSDQLAWLHRNGLLLSRTDGPESITVTARLSAQDQSRFAALSDHL